MRAVGRRAGAQRMALSAERGERPMGAMGAGAMGAEGLAQVRREQTHRSRRPSRRIDPDRK